MLGIIVQIARMRANKERSRNGLQRAAMGKSSGGNEFASFRPQGVGLLGHRRGWPGKIDCLSLCQPT